MTELKHDIAAVDSVGTGANPLAGSMNQRLLMPISIAIPLANSAAFFIAPLGFLVILGFWVVVDYQVVPTFSLENYADIATHMFAKSNYALSILQSLWVALTTAFVATSLCYIMVMALVFVVPEHRQRLALVLAIAPFWSSYILRVFSWQALLAKKGVINSGFIWLGLDNLQIDLIYTQIATRIGLIHYLAPVLIIVLYVTVANIDRNLIHAARDLGATRWQVFVRVILPMSRTGIIVAASFAAIISFGDVLSGAVLGGGAGTSILGSVPLFSNMIMVEYASSTNLPRTACLALILVLIMLVMLVVGVILAERGQKDMAS